LQRRTCRLIFGPLAAEFHQLIKSRHSRHSQTRQAASLPHISCNHTFRATTHFVQPHISRDRTLPSETGIATPRVWHRPVSPSHTLPRGIIHAGEKSFHFPLRLNRRRR
jgi:hypothetical protein